MINPFVEDRKERIQRLLRLIQDATRQDKEIVVSRLKGEMFLNWGLQMKLIDEYLDELKQMGLIRFELVADYDKDPKIDKIEIIKFLGQAELYAKKDDTGRLAEADTEHKG